MKAIQLYIVLLSQIIAIITVYVLIATKDSISGAASGIAFSMAIYINTVIGLWAFIAVETTNNMASAQRVQYYTKKKPEGDYE